MPEIMEGIDALGFYYTGGATNSDPDASLGGARSSHRSRGMGFLIQGLPIPAVVIDDIFPACGEGFAYLRVGTDGESILFAAPDGIEGETIALLEGDSKVVEGSSPSKALRVYREPGMIFPAGRRMDILLRYPINGGLGQANLTSAQRAAGRTTYRGLILYAHGNLQDLKLWMPAVGGAQATFSLALENTLTGTIQTIANETTAPTGVTFSTPTTEATALMVGAMSAGTYYGLWVRRVFPPAGIVAVRENVQLATKFRSVP